MQPTVNQVSKKRSLEPETEGQPRKQPGQSALMDLVHPHAAEDQIAARERVNHAEQPPGSSCAGNEDCENGELEYASAMGPAETRARELVENVGQCIISWLEDWTAKVSNDLKSALIPQLEGAFTRLGQDLILNANTLDRTRDSVISILYPWSIA